MMSHKKSRKRNVLFLVDQLLELGGAERVLFRIIENMPQEKFRCSLATFRGCTVDLQARVACPVHVFPITRTYNLRALSVARQLRRLIRGERIDIVHTFFETSDLWGGLIAKLSGCPVLISSRRDLGILRSRKHAIGYRLMNPLYDCVLAVSDSVREYCIREDQIDPEKVITLYNGLELESVDWLRGRSVVPKSICTSSPIVTTVANIRRIKGLDVFIRAAAIARRHFPETKFAIIGGIADREVFEELQSLSRSVGLDDSLIFVGPVEDVIPYLKISNIFCLLSRSEGFSNALLEAMACGLPCIASDVGGNAEAIVHAESGFLVPSGDAESAAFYLTELLANPQHASACGKAARARVESHFSDDIMVRQLTNIYESLLSGTSPTLAVCPDAGTSAGVTEGNLAKR